jgi:SAM-dependent methyltransferase
VTMAEPRPPFGERARYQIARISNRGVGWLRRRFAPPSFPASADGKLRLHLGCGTIDAPGFVNVDLLDAPHVHLQRPLDDLSTLPDDSVDFVYACHCLEHFGYRHTRMVLQEWVRVLRPAGILRLSVPDFAVLASAYAAGSPLREIEGPLLGGQDYRLNFHGAVFDETLLRELMMGVGLIDVRRWEPATADHHDFTDESTSVLRRGAEQIPLSLNLEGRKAALASRRSG